MRTHFGGGDAVLGRAGSVQMGDAFEARLGFNGCAPRLWGARELSQQASLVSTCSLNEALQLP